MLSMKEIPKQTHFVILRTKTNTIFENWNWRSVKLIINQMKVYTILMIELKANKKIMKWVTFQKTKNIFSKNCFSKTTFQLHPQMRCITFHRFINHKSIPQIVRLCWVTRVCSGEFNAAFRRKWSSEHLMLISLWYHFDLIWKYHILNKPYYSSFLCCLGEFSLLENFKVEHQQS